MGSVHLRAGGKTRKRFQSASSWRVGRKDREYSMSERMGKERERERMNRESAPISGQSPANFGACQIHPPVIRQSAQRPLFLSLFIYIPRLRSPPSLPLLARPPKPMLRGIARFCTLSPPLPPFHVYCRIFLHACRIPLSLFLSHTRSINRTPGYVAMKGLCTRSR